MTLPKKYVCIHGHFYQPPRENPWLEAIEREDSAAPFHDWNERIDSECYRANTAARLVDEANMVLNLRNNYKSMSFNFGPTLLRWIERHDPRTYRSLQEADRESAERLDGHGNALAQVYSHLIMPLANRRDKVTQVAWGIRDFEHAFGRKPEGMWLAEAAVDRETLQVLAEAGIRFTILSPYQAKRWREKGCEWQDASGGQIPTGCAYRYDCGRGKSIDLFFYDGSLARGIAFERLLEHSSKLVAQIHARFEAGNALVGDRPWLVHTATDGESYGHHFKFGDMALAAAFHELERDPAVQILNYGAFLAAFPAQAEVEIFENSAWSCAHGLGRWQEDCGCHIGGESGWNQQWRAPLREALNGLRDTLAAHFERAMLPLCRDPWRARDTYIDVLIDPDGHRDTFAHTHLRPDVDDRGSIRFFQLLEMQRFAMLMFTSCGWFFDDLAGLESLLVQRYAARAIQLAVQTGAPSPEPALVKILVKAQSNMPGYGNGAQIYEHRIKPGVVNLERVAANYAIQSLARATERQFEMGAYAVAPQQEEDLGTSPTPGLYGHIRIREMRTGSEGDYLYTVLHFGGLDFRCSVKAYESGKEYQEVLKALQRCVEEQNTAQMIRVIDEVFAPSTFGLQDLFKDVRTAIAREISQRTLSTYSDFQRHFYQVYRPLLVSLRQTGTGIPSDLRVAIRRVLSDELMQLVQDMLAHEAEAQAETKSWETTDFFYRAHLGRLHSLLEDAHTWKFALQTREAELAIGPALAEAISALKDSFAPSLAGKVFRLLSLCRELGIKPELWTLQTLYFDLIHAWMRHPVASRRLPQSGAFFAEFDGFLGCRFARWLEVH